MSQLQSMLVPLDTLAGWPPATDPSALQVIGLLFGFPALVCAIIYAIAKIGTVAKAGRGGPAEVTQPVWVGGRQASGELETDSAGATAIRAEVTAGSTRSSLPESADEPRAQSGGAGARW